MGKLLFETVRNNEILGPWICQISFNTVKKTVTDSFNMMILKYCVQKKWKKKQQGKRIFKTCLHLLERQKDILSNCTVLIIIKDGMWVRWKFAQHN